MEGSVFRVKVSLSEYVSAASQRVRDQTDRDGTKREDRQIVSGISFKCIAHNGEYVGREGSCQIQLSHNHIILCSSTAEIRSDQIRSDHTTRSISLLGIDRCIIPFAASHEWWS